jgi:hypothetical protein
MVNCFTKGRRKREIKLRVKEALFLVWQRQEVGWKTFAAYGVDRQVAPGAGRQTRMFFQNNMTLYSRFALALTCEETKTLAN